MIREMTIDIEREFGYDFDPVRIPATCWMCHMKQTRLVKTLEHGTRTHCKVGVCTNAACSRFTKVAELTTWVRE